MGFIKVKQTVIRKIKVSNCIKCGSDNITLGDCGYSSFNVAFGKCKNCGNEVSFNCSWNITEEEIAKAWNKQNDKKLLIKAYRKEISKLEKKIVELSKTP